MGQQGRAKHEAPVRHHHDHRQVLHLAVELQEAKPLEAKPVFEPRHGVHLHLLQHNRLLRGTLDPRSRPERPIEAIVRRF